MRLNLALGIILNRKQTKMKSSRQLSKLFTLLLYLISIAFAFFLLQAGSLVIKNIPKVGVDTTFEDFVDEKAEEEIENQLELIESELEILEMENHELQARYEGIKKDIELEKETYKAILASRYVTEDGNNNSDVEASRKKLETERAKLKAENKRLSELSERISLKENEKKKQQQAKRKLYRDAEKIQEDRENENTLKAFGIRLAFVLPLLGVSIFLFKKYRKSRYWPFVFGFGYFSLYAFFVELVPYFPSYGGYVRALVGIILCFLLGKIVIQKLHAYLEQKRELELQDEGERRSKLQDKESNLESAYAKLNKKICPSCDRKLADVENKYCVYCGLCIKKECPSCNQLQSSFNQFCFECGAKQESSQASLSQ